VAGTFIITGVKEFNTAMKAASARADLAVRTSLVEMSQVVVQESRAQFTTVVETKGGTQGVLARGARGPAGSKIVRRGPHLDGSQPHIRTGNLARSIKADPPQQTGFGVYRAIVAPRAAYGRRIEKGFTGEDSMNRNYEQPPYPYLEPGLNAARPKMTAIYERNMRGVF
jgi:hypothetical protein